MIRAHLTLDKLRGATRTLEEALAKHEPFHFGANFAEKADEGVVLMDLKQCGKIHKIYVRAGSGSHQLGDFMSTLLNEGIILVSASLTRP